MKRNGVSSTNCNIGTQTPVKAGGGLIQTLLILGKLLNTFWINLISSTSDIYKLSPGIISFYNIQFFSPQVMSTNFTTGLASAAHIKLILQVIPFLPLTQ